MKETFIFWGRTASVNHQGNHSHLNSSLPKKNNQYSAVTART